MARHRTRGFPIDETRLRALLQRFKDDGLSLDDVAAELRELPYEDLGFAKVDHHRAIRKGFPEVIFGQGKSPEQIKSITEALLGGCDTVLVTRASAEAFAVVREAVPDARFDEMALSRCR